jgi:FtsZ-binding cell division protein ZapB
MSDDLALLQIKVRHTNELEEKVESLLRQNSQLARDNDELARELSERRY